MIDETMKNEELNLEMSPAETVCAAEASGSQTAARNGSLLTSDEYFIAEGMSEAAVAESPDGVQNSPSPTSDEYFIAEAMREADIAESLDEVPIGAVAVRDGVIIARAHNLRESNKCATHHAEILCIEDACRALGGWRLPGVTLYVTLEPCAMCAGAIVNARIPRVVFGARDHRFGAFGSALNIAEVPLNHTPEVKEGVLAEECADLLSSYFKRKRAKNK